MPLWGPKCHATILVKFFDAASQQEFAQSRMPIDQLPESFEAQTTMHLKDADWAVLEARPMTRAEMANTGRLVLILSKVTKLTVDPNKVLFSLPTIENAGSAPIRPRSSKMGVATIELHEDDWRQVEWISSSLADAVETEIAAIRGIYETERQGPGFRKCHLRRGIPLPFADGGPSIEELRLSLGPKCSWLAGVSYIGVAGLAEGAFAVRLISSIKLYGVSEGHALSCCCFQNMRANNVSSPDVLQLASFARRHELLLVDWCRASVVLPDDDAYAAFFGRATTT